jgi:hypothetical protein
MDAIEHRLATKIKGIFHVKQMCLKGKEYLIKYKGCHHNKIVWMKPAHLDCLSNTVAKFKQERGHEFGVKKTPKKKPRLQLA